MLIKKMARKAADGYINLLANYGDTGTNIASGGGYLNNYVSRNPQVLRTMYRTSFIVRRACDQKAEDMTKAGIRIDSTIDTDKLQACQAELRRAHFWKQMANTIRWAQLFGTAYLMPVIDGQDPAKPLRPETVGKGQLVGWQVLDRWQVVPSWLDGRITRLGNDNGYPIYYMTIANGMGLPELKIHHSRLFRIDACTLPAWDLYQENFFSASIVESILDRVKAFDQASAAAAALVEAARNDVIYTDSLPQAAGENQGLYGRITEKFKAMMRFRSNNGITVLSTEDKLERFSTTLSGVAEILDRMASQVAGAVNIPLCLLLKESSAGLSSGDGDLIASYYEDIGAMQNNMLLTHVESAVLMTLLSLGIQASQDKVSCEFNPLKKPSVETRSKVASEGAATVISAYEAGLISAPCAMQELKGLTRDTGFFSNITQEDIDMAENNPPPTPDENEPEPGEHEPAKPTKLRVVS